MAQDHIVPRFEIPKHWERIGGVDFGISDPTVLLMGAIDPLRGIVYLYEEHYENQKPVNYHAEKMLKMINPIPSTLLLGLIADPSGRAKSKKDMRSTYDHYAEYGLYFKDGINKIEDGIMKVYTYFSLGKIKIFEDLYSTVREVKKYKYPERDLNSDKNAPDKPLDKDNHGMDSLKYLISELPDDPTQLQNPSVGYHTVHGYGSIQHDHIPHELQDNEEESTTNWLNYY